MVREIEHLVNGNDGLRVIVSSRPHSGLEASPVFQVLKLSDLEGDEYKTVIHKLLDDNKTAADLIKQVQSHQGDVKELLKTPLLVTLLVINYKSFQEIPAQLSGFYDSLFKLLLQRHDGTKPGYRRQRLCGLNDTEYRLVFEAFCYLAKQHQQAILDHQKVYNATQRALKAAGAKEDPEKYICDIVKITCLLVRDGEEYRFIHKSVQEYYAACFVKSRPDVVASKLYSKLMMAFRRSQDWRQELHFLSEIDAYRFRKFGLIPAISFYLGINGGHLDSATPDQVTGSVLARLRETRMYLTVNPENPKEIKSVATSCDIIPTLARECIRPLFKIDYAPALDSATATRLHPGAPNEFELVLGDAFDRGLLVSEIKNASLEIVTALLAEGKEALARTAHEEQDSIALLPLS